MDTATGLLYVGNGMYYDPQTGRFLNRNVHPEQTNPYVPWGDPAGAMVAPLALLALVFTNKKKRTKLDYWIIALVLGLSAGMSLTGCGPVQPAGTPLSQGTATISMPIENGEQDYSGSNSGGTPMPAGEPVDLPTWQCTITFTQTPMSTSTPAPTFTATPIPTATVTPWEELWKLIEFVNVSDEYMPIFKEAVIQVANAFSHTLGQLPVDCFISIFKLTPDKKLKFEMGSCSDCDGSGGFTHTAHWIEFDANNPFFDVTYGEKDLYNRTSEMAFELNVHNVIHELGHAFAALWNYRNDDGQIVTVPGSPNTLSFPDAKFLTDEGFKYPYRERDYMGMLWRMHAAGIDPNDIYENDGGSSYHKEAFADMFLSWVYDGAGFTLDGIGPDRRTFMNEHMPLWLNGQPPFPSSN